MALGAKAAADDTPGVKLTESAPAEVNGPKQVQLFQSAARASKDGVAMMTLTPELFIRPLQQAGRTERAARRRRRAAAGGHRGRRQAADRQLQRRDRPGPRQGAAPEDPRGRQGRDPDRHRHARPAGARAAQPGLQGGHGQGAPGREVHRLRRQAEPDRQLQHVERAGEGAPGRARLRRPGQPGRGVAVADPAQDRQEVRRRRLRPRPGGAARASRTGSSPRSSRPSTGSRATSRSS